MTHPMELQGGVNHTVPCFGPFGDSVIWTQDRCTYAPNVPLAQKSFWSHPMELLGDVTYVESCFDLFGDSVSVSAR
jgi:hypothetical protein